MQTVKSRAPVSKMERLPGFFAVGPPRTATTWLHFTLKDRVNLPDVKELEFFDHRYENGVAWYQRHWRHGLEELPWGEIAPTYFYSAQARQRIASLIPKAKIICTLRDPVERLYSLYKLKRSSGALRCSFARAVESDFEMRESSRYAFYLSGWIRTFGKDRVMVLLHEDLKSDANGYLAGICEFLGIPAIDIRESKSDARNASAALPAPILPYWTHFGIRAADFLECNGYDRTLAWIRRFGLRRLFLSNRKLAAPPLDPAFAEELRTRMRGEIEHLEAILDRDLSAWKTAKPTESIQADAYGLYKVKRKAAAPLQQ